MHFARNFEVASVLQVQVSTCLERDKNQSSLNRRGHKSLRQWSNQVQEAQNVPLTTRRNSQFVYWSRGFHQYRRVLTGENQIAKNKR